MTPDVYSELIMYFLVVNAVHLHVVLPGPFWCWTTNQSKRQLSRQQFMKSLIVLSFRAGIVCLMTLMLKKKGFDGKGIDGLVPSRMEPKWNISHAVPFAQGLMGSGYCCLCSNKQCVCGDSVQETDFQTTFYEVFNFTVLPGWDGMFDDSNVKKKGFDGLVPSRMEPKWNISHALPFAQGLMGSGYCCLCSNKQCVWRFCTKKGRSAVSDGQPELAWLLSLI